MEALSGERSRYFPLESEETEAGCLLQTCTVRSRVFANALPPPSFLSVPVPSSGSGGPLVQPDVGSVSVPGGRDRAQVQPLRPWVQAGKVAPPALHT